MTDSNGVFYSSLNADSEGEEGRFYVWTLQQFLDALPDNHAELMMEYYRVNDEGNWENGLNILHRQESPEEFAHRKQIDPVEWSLTVAEANKRLLQVRSDRIRPSTDDKILTSWNAMMIIGYLDAFRALGEHHYLEVAKRAAATLVDKMVRKDGRLLRNHKDGRSSIDAFLDDYATLGLALAELYSLTFEQQWLQLSRRIADMAIRLFKDPDDPLFFYTPSDGESLIARKKELADNVIPSSNSIFAKLLYLLGHYYDENSYLEQSEKMVDRVAANIPTGGPYYANWAMLLGLMTHTPFEVAVTGSGALKTNHELQSRYLPNSFFLGGNTEELALLKGKVRQDGTWIYVCRNKSCKMPVKAVTEALNQMKG
jgi:uncharacterized protein YyaL (SSP411 family)